MLKNLRLGVLFLLMIGFTYPAQAQFLKKLKNKINQATSSKKSTDISSSAKKEEVANLSDWNKSHAGQVIFYNKYLERQSAGSDSQSGVITEGVLASKSPLYFRAYLGKSYKSNCADCNNLEVRYTMGGKSITTQEVRDELSRSYARMASAVSFYDSRNYAVGVALNAAPGRYYDMYTLQEDAYRILLSKIEDKIQKGATLKLKVEIMAVKNKSAQSEILAVGEIPLTVTAESYDLQNLNCRCGKAGMNNAKEEKEALDAFAFQFNDVEKVYKVVFNERDFTQFHDNSYYRNVLGKGMNANFIYKNDKGIYMQSKYYIYHKKDGNSFSDRITIGKHQYSAPVSPTCAK